MDAPLTGLGAITLFVEDLARAKVFYGDAFGLHMVFADDHSAAFDFGNTIINLLVAGEGRALIEPAIVAPSAAGVRSQLTIWVDDADAACARLARHGVTLLNGPIDRPWGKRTAAFADPDGHVWEVAQDIPSPTS